MNTLFHPPQPPPGFRLAPAKLNIRLKVIGRRKDGYHELVSIMVPVALYDRIEIRLNSQSSSIKVQSSGFQTPENETNLVCRAAAAFFARTGLPHGVHIQLTKNIPVGAGLGGGSSDAACVLKALNQLAGNRLDHQALMEISQVLGADVPFFLDPRPSIARGIGERLEPVLEWPRCWYVIAVPPAEVSTAWVYSEFARLGREGHGSQDKELGLTTSEYAFTIDLLKSRPLNIPRLLENDLERVTSACLPEIQRLKDALIRAEAEGACMSGSGSAVFGVFFSEERALRAKSEIMGPHNNTVVFAVEGLQGERGLLDVSS